MCKFAHSKISLIYFEKLKLNIINWFIIDILVKLNEKDKIKSTEEDSYQILNLINEIVCAHCDVVKGKEINSCRTKKKSSVIPKKSYKKWLYNI